jgi:hypothetical protein
MGLAAVAAVAITASDTVTGRFVEGPGLAVDATGQVQILVPDGWRAESGVWTPPSSVGGRRGPVLEVSPDPARWKVDPTVPGAFIWFSGDHAPAPAALVAKQAPTRCVPTRVRATRQAGVDWVVAGYRRCPDGRALIVEAVGTRAGHGGLVYVEVAPPANSTPAFVDTLLAGLRVRWPD